MKKRILLLIIIGGGDICFFSFIVKKVLNGSVLEGTAIGCAASFLMLQWMPSCVEGLYWYNGAVNYCLFYMIMLFLICSVISLHLAQGKKQIFDIFFCCLLGFLLEGGNHVTAFMGLIFVFCFISIELYQHKKKKVLYMGIIFAVMAICFIINISSPGTIVRQSYFSKMPIMECLKSALTTGMEQIGTWFGLSSIVVALLVMPIYIRLVRRVCAVTSFRFPNPFIIFVFSVAWICAMYCPPLYAMGMSGAGRLHNIVYYNFIILFLVNVFYCTGWVMCKFDAIDARYNSQLNYINWFYCVIVLITGLLISKWDTTWSFKANEAIESGIAGQYSQEAYNRNNLLLESQGKDVVVNKYTAKTAILFFDDIKSNPEENEGVKNFYNLNSIIAK